MKPEYFEQQHFPRVFAGVFAFVRRRIQLLFTITVVKSSKIIACAFYEFIDLLKCLLLSTFYSVIFLYSRYRWEISSVRSR